MDCGYLCRLLGLLLVASTVDLIATLFLAYQLQLSNACMNSTFAMISLELDLYAAVSLSCCLCGVVTFHGR